MWTVSPATFSNGGGVLPTGPKVEPSSIRTSSRTLMVDWVAPVTSIVTCLPVRIWHTELDRRAHRGVAEVRDSPAS
jgi:hypothetical protein